MLDSRPLIALPILPIGLGLGLILWLALGRAGAFAEADELAGRLNAVRLPSAAPSEVGGGTAASRPLFALTSGPGAIAEASLRLDGVSRSARRVAALVSIDNAPAQWIEVGQNLDDIVLEEVRSSEAVFDTPLGMRTVRLGEAGGPGSASDAGGAGEPDTIPPGFRSPPPPASAPSAGG